MGPVLVWTADLIKEGPLTFWRKLPYMFQIRFVSMKIFTESLEFHSKVSVVIFQHIASVSGGYSVINPTQNIDFTKFYHNSYNSHLDSIGDRWLAISKS